MKLRQEFNGYLGFEPVSLFVSLIGTYTLESAYKFYRDIACRNTKDIIFEGDLTKNLEFMSWITAKLIYEEHYVSMVFNLQELWRIKVADVMAQRIILVVAELFKGWSKVLETMSERDIILVKTKKVHHLALVKDKMQEINCQSSLYFDSTLLSKESVLTHDIVTAYPYGG